MCEGNEAEKGSLRKRHDEEISLLSARIQELVFQSKHSSLIADVLIDSLEESCESLRARLESVYLESEETLTRNLTKLTHIEIVCSNRVQGLEAELEGQTAMIEENCLLLKKQEIVIYELKQSLMTSKSQLHHLCSQLDKERANFEDRMLRQDQEAQARSQAAERRIEKAEHDRNLLTSKLADLEEKLSKMKSAVPEKSGEDIQDRIRATAKENLTLKERLKEVTLERSTADRLHKAEMREQEKRWLDLVAENRRLVDESINEQSALQEVHKTLADLKSELAKNQYELTFLRDQNEKLASALAVKEAESAGFAETLVSIAVMTECESIQPDLSDSLQETLDELRNIRELVSQAENNMCVA